MIEINERENHKRFYKLNNVFGSVHYIYCKTKLSVSVKQYLSYDTASLMSQFETIVVGSLQITFSMCSILYTFFHHLIATVPFSYCAVFTLKTYDVDFGIPLSC